MAVIIQFGVAVGLALWLGFQYTPYTAFIFVATMFTLVLIAIYILINVACIGYYWRYQRKEANWFMHGLIPLLGIAAFVPAFLTAGVIKAFKFVAPLAYPVSLSGLVVGIWTVLGVVYLVYLHSRHPERIRQTERIFLDEPTATTAAPAGGRTDESAA